MSFDTEPKDQYERILWYHPESDCYGECFSTAEFEELCGQEPYLDDVTGVDHHEEEWKKRKNQEA